MTTGSDRYTGDDVLDIMSKYAPNRNKGIERLIVKHLGLDKLTSQKSILEFGAGKGEFINRFTGNPNLITHAVELDPVYMAELSKKHKTHESIDAAPNVDFIYLIDVLEHLEKDEEFLKKFYDKLNPGGKVFIYVPARMELYSAFDKKIGHFRRYYPKELSDKMKRAGFKMGVIRYHEILGYAASLANKLISGEETLNPSAVKFYDRVLVPLTNFAESMLPIPIGKSIYALGIKS